MDKHGVWKDNPKDIKKIITDYFEELFQATVTSDGLSKREIINRVTYDQNSKLVTPVTHEKVKEAVFSMFPKKSPELMD